MSGRRCLRVIDVDVLLEWSDDALAQLAQVLFRDLPPGSRADIRLRLDDYVGDGTDGLPHIFARSERDLTERLLQHLGPRYWLLHASVFARSGAALLALGGHDAGKTSIACAMAMSGWALLSDDIAPVRPSDQTVAPFLRDVILHAGTESCFPNRLPGSPPCKTFDGYRHVAPADLAESSDDVKPTPVRGVLLPARSVATPPRIEAVGPAHVAATMLQQCFDLENIGGQQAAACAAQLSTLPAATVQFDDVTQVVPHVERWFESHVEA